jgi:metal-sulfur cluster biosynthetic enzyme
MLTAPEPARRDHAAHDPTVAVAAVWRGLAGIGDPCHVLSGHGLSIVDVGIVNRVDVVGDTVEVGVTFTEAGCTFAYSIIEQIEDLAPGCPGVREIRVVPEHYPMWTPDRLSEKARTLFADKRAAFGVGSRGRRQPVDSGANT